MSTDSYVADKPLADDKSVVSIPESLVSQDFQHPSEHRNLRSPLWEKVKNIHLKLQPVCQACGLRTKLAVHHIKPFHLFPELELVQSNLITLCEDGVHDCHYHFGHLLSWHAYNPDVVKDSDLYIVKVRTRLTA